MTSFFSRHRTEFSVGLLLLLTSLFSLLTITHGFLSDDFDMVLRVQDSNFEPLSVFVTDRDGIVGQGNVYRPLFVLSFWKDHLLWGQNPFGYHLMNSALHVVGTLFVFLFLRECLRQMGKQESAERIAWISGLLFGILPIHAESVWWISGRTDLLAFTPLMIGLFFWMRGRRVLPLLFLFISLLGKEMAVVSPAIIALLSWMRGEHSLKRMLRETAPWIGVVALYLGIRFSITGAAFGGYEQISVFTSLGSALETIFGHLIYLFFFWVGDARASVLLFVQDKTTLLALFGLVGSAAFLFWFHRKISSPVLFAMLWIGIFLLPVMNIPIDLFSRGGERAVYVASLGVCFLIALFFERLLRSHLPQKAVLFFLACLLGAFGSISVTSSRQWQHASLFASSTPSFFEQLSADPKDGVVRILLLDRPDRIGSAYLWRNGLEEALKLSDPERTYDIVALPFTLNLSEESSALPAVSWEQTDFNFFVGTPRREDPHLLSSTPFSRTEDYATELRGFRDTGDVGDEAWVELLNPLQQRFEGHLVHLVYFDEGRWKEMGSGLES